MSDTWFTNLEDIIYSAVEHIPLVGTVYSVKRASIGWHEHDWNRHWESVANVAESAVRDVILLKDLFEPAPVVIIHTMVEALTDKLIDIYASPATPEIKIHSAINKNERHVIIAGGTKAQSEKVAAELFGGKWKGIHDFHKSLFTGTLTDQTYAANGEKLTLSLPEGLYDGARCIFLWRWTVDANGVKNRPESTIGLIQLEFGNPTRFRLTSRKGYYDFQGKILSKDTISVTWSGNKEITMTRHSALIEPGVYKIVNAKTGTVLAISRSDHRSVIGWTSGDQLNQRWTVSKPDVNDNQTIQSVDRPDQYLSLGGGSLANSTPLVGANPFAWTIRADKDRNDHCRVSVPKTNFVVDLDGGHPHNGTKVQLWLDHATDSQRWRFEKTN